ncbi:MAG: alpha/beta hydrolase [Firmicutes bacterium]|nr:alpha/beta hydrolase [Bacillota bacterium]
MAEGNDSVREHMVEVDGRRLHVLEKGEGDDVLYFLHGNSETAYNWLEVWSHLQTRWRLIALTMPGYGDSEREWRVAHTLRHLARISLTALSRLGIERATLVGHSQGGGVSLAAALQEPRRVRGLALLASIGVPFEDEGLGRNRLIPRRPRVWFEWFLRTKRGQSILREQLAQGIEQTTHPVVPDLSTPEWQRDLSIWSRARHIIAANEDLKLLSRELRDIYDQFVHIEVPTLVLAAREDQLIPVEAGEILARRLPKGQLDVVPGAGHFFIRTHSGEVANRLEKWLSTV